MNSNSRARQPAGTLSPGRRFTIGGMAETGLKDLLEAPAACSFWEPGSKTKRQGVLYRDPRRGLTIRFADSWQQGQTSGPTTIDVPILLGRLAEGHFFSLHDVQVISDLHQSELDAVIGYLGAWVDGVNPTFDGTVAVTDQAPHKP